MLAEILILSAVIISYFGVGFVFNKRKMSPFLGLEFFLIGVLFSFLKVEKSTFLPILPPLLATFGLLMGVQIRISDLKALRWDFYKKVFSYTILVFPPLFLIFISFFPREIASVIASVFALGSYKLMATFIRDRKKEDRKKLFFSAFLPFVVTVLYFFSIFTFISPSVTRWFFVLLILFSLLSKVLFSVLEDRSLIVLSLMGAVLFFSEISYIKGVSPFLVMFFVGFYLANYCKRIDVLFSILISDEKQLYTIFLIFLGFLSGFVFDFNVLKFSLIILFSVIFVKFLAFLFYKESFVFYLSPGAFGVVLLSDYWLLSGHKSGDRFFFSSILVIIFLQVVSMIYLKRVYAKGN